jgi:flagellar basal body-associated protein FliL
MVQPAPAPGKKSNKTLYIILGVIAFLILCCVCIGLPLAYMCGDVVFSGGSCGF